MINIVDFVNLFRHDSLMKPRTQIDKFRHFNRFYTNYLGLLTNSVYDRPVSLTEARVLYELDAGGETSASALRERLGLDKGYVSRIVKRFLQQEWISTAPSPFDARVKRLSLTQKGEALMADLHAKAADQARRALSRLTPDRRKQLLSAMAEIETLLSE